MDSRVVVERTNSRNKAWLRMSWALICIGGKIEADYI
jgi:hypothetical protein